MCTKLLIMGMEWYGWIEYLRNGGEMGENDVRVNMQVTELVDIRDMFEPLKLNI